MDFVTVLVLIASIITMALPNIIKKFYNGNAPFFLSAVSCFFSAVLFLFLSGFNLSFDWNLLVYSGLMSLTFGCATVFSLLALRCGDLSLTGLIMSLSLIIPTLYGIIILNNPVGVPFYIGLVALVASLSLINLNFKKKKDADVNNPPQKKKFNVKWLVFITIAAVCNGFSSIIQTEQQLAYNGEKKIESMLLVFVIVTLVTLIISLITERKFIKEKLVRTFVIGSTSGVATGVLNYTVMVLVGLVDAALLFPLISGGSLLIIFVVAPLIFKEKYRPLQYVGFALGLLSVVLLNL